MYLPGGLRNYTPQLVCSLTSITICPVLEEYDAALHVELWTGNLHGTYGEQQMHGVTRCSSKMRQYAGFYHSTACITGTYKSIFRPQRVVSRQNAISTWMHRFTELSPPDTYNRYNIFAMRMKRKTTRYKTNISSYMPFCCTFQMAIKHALLHPGYDSSGTLTRGH